MPRHVALFRSLNVGGKNMVTMSALSALFVRLGFTRVEHYVNSGNIVFDAPGEADAGAVTQRIAEAFAAEFQFPGELLLRSSAQLEATVAACPFAEAARAAPTTVHVVFVDRPLDERAREGLSGAAAANEGWAEGDGVVYLHTPDGIGRSKLGAVLPRRLTGVHTARNWRSVLALADLASRG